MTKNIITLDFPIEANGSKVNSLTLRRPTVGDLLASGKGRNDKEAEIHLLADLCSVAPDDIKQLDLSDYTKLQEVLGKMQGQNRKH